MVYGLRRGGFVPPPPHIFLTRTGTNLTSPGSCVSGEVKDKDDSSVKKVKFCGRQL
jgi:hypothetical protein